MIKNLIENKVKSSFLEFLLRMTFNKKVKMRSFKDSLVYLQGDDKETLLSNIEWTSVSWNPLTGCNKISPNCQNYCVERISYCLKKIYCIFITNYNKVFFSKVY